MSLRLPIAMKAGMIVGLLVAVNILSLIPFGRATGTNVPIVITGPTQGSTVNGSTATITGTGPASKSFYLTVDSVALPNRVTIDSNGQWSADTGTLTQGSHSVKAVFVDGQGMLNSSADASANASFDLGSGSVTAFQAGLSMPSMAALDEVHNRLFIYDGTPYLKVYDSQTNASVGTINTASTTHPYTASVSSLIYDAGRSKLFVFTNDEALVVDPTTLGITARANNPCPNVAGVQASPTTAKVYEYNHSPTDPLCVFDRGTSTYSTLGSILGVRQVSVSRDGTKAAVAFWNSPNSIAILDTGTGIFSSTTFTGNFFQYFVMDPVNTRLYTVDNTGFAVYDTSTGTQLSTSVSPGAGTFQMNSAGTKLYTYSKAYDIASGTFSGNMTGQPNFVDPAGTYVYAPLGDGTVGVYDASGTLANTIANDRSGATKVYFASSSPKAFVLNTYNGSYSVINTTTQTVTATVEPGLRHATTHVTLPDGSKTYALGVNSSAIQRLDTTTGSVISTIQLPGQVRSAPSGAKTQAVSVSAAGDFLYAITNTNIGTFPQMRLVKISTSTDLVVSSLLLSTWFDTYSLAIDQTAGVAYGTNVSDGALLVINMTTGVVSKYLSGQVPSGQVLLSPDGTILYIHASFSNTVFKVDTASKAILSTATIASGVDMALSPDGSQVYVSNYTCSPSPCTTYITKLNAATLAVEQQVSLGTGILSPGLSVAPSGVIFVTYSPYVYTLDATTLELYGKTRIRSAGYDQPGDMNTSTVLELKPSTFYLSQASLNFSISLPPVTVATSSLPDASKNRPYSAQLVAANVVGSQTWTLDSGALPAGLSLSSAGVLSGTPTGLGTSTFTVRITDSRPTSATAQLQIMVLLPPAGYADDLIGQLDGLGLPAWDQSGSAASINGLRHPTSVVTDSVHHRLYAFDCGNHRVQVYNLDTSNRLLDHAADYVIGQPDFSSSSYAVSDVGLRCIFDGGLAYDPARGYLFVSDYWNDRVMIYDTNSLATGMAASFVLGQSTFDTSGYGLTQNELCGPAGLAFDTATTNLYVADSCNDRIMVFNTTTMSNSMNAINVIGQADFTTDDYSATTRSTTHYPISVALDESGRRLFVADVNNVRVLIFDISVLSNGPDAVGVIGQPDYTSSAYNNVLSASVLQNPVGVVYDTTNQRLFVLDWDSNRLLSYDVSSPTPGQAAQAVIGQPDFATGAYPYPPTRYSYDTNESTPWYDSVNHQLFVPDYYDNRVMIYYTLQLNPGTLGGGQVDTAYSGTITAANDQGQVSYTLHSGSLPPGLTLASSGAVSGTPTTAGTYTFGIRAADDWGAMGTMIDTLNYTITIGPKPVAPSQPAQPASATPSPTPAPTATPAPTPSPAPAPAELLNADPSYSTDAGSAQEIAVGGNVRFTVDTTQTHTVTVLDVGPNYVDVLVQSEPIRLRLYLGDTKDVDVDLDGHSDIRIHLASLTGSSAQMVFKDLKLAAIKTTPSPTPTKAPQAAGETTPASSPWLPLMLVGLGLVAVAGIVGWLFYRRARNVRVS